MPPRKILVTDEDPTTLEMIADQLQSRFLIKSCTDGQQALQLIREWEPDIFVLDLELRQLDGLSLLKQAAKEGFSPMILVVTGFYNKYVLDSLMELNVDFLLRKPARADAISGHILSLNKRLRPPPPSIDELMPLITQILIDLGIANNRDGFRYLQAGIPLLTLDRNQRFSKELYPAISTQCGGSPTQIEKDIRESIQAAWINRDDTIWSKYFKPGKNGSIPKLTNTSFVTTLADYLITSFIAVS